jgi:hypothetical protein
MTLAELITLYRADSGDEATPPFCSDALLTIYANEAEEEASRRAKLLRDSTSSVCTIAFEADDETISLDPVILQVLRVFVNGREACVVNVDHMDSVIPGWQFSLNRDRPVRLVSGLTSGKLHLWPRPKEDGAVTLTVERLPLESMSATTDAPEIRPELHRSLVPWMLYRAYSREDSDLYNDRKAAIHLAKFEAEFGQKASGRNEEWVRAGEKSAPEPIA